MAESAIASGPAETPALPSGDGPYCRAGPALFALILAGWPEVANSR
jgi:hypothetical protein